ncbi:vignain precursor [Stylonychia lemnae]|uniref:Vignain n=1 Tax=Stylonychia lemnae TaxID=5949 RepID=A0A078BCM8_STYLE|nr:vignain precursor [Stylonychia lemnae]|eukprot:CDW91358.1 vignain precursor [Stylonychia lemnae]
MIEDFNAQGDGVKLKLNKFFDIDKETLIQTQDTFLSGTQNFKNIRQSDQKLNNNDQIADDRKLQGTVGPQTNLLEALDWRHQNKVSSVKDQQGCSAGYAFSSIAALESSLMIKDPVRYSIVDLSEQQILDCSVNNGCEGGQVPNVFQYSQRNGITTEALYPYAGSQQQCKQGVRGQILTKNYKHLDTDLNVYNIKKAVQQQPVSASICASSDVFMFYSSGVITSGCCTSVDHNILLVGWNKTQEGMPYWIGKNSYGTQWGEDGYVRIKMEEGSYYQTCGLATTLTYPILP